MRPFPLVALMAICALAAPRLAAQAPDSILASARPAAEHWLALLASSEYAASWQQAAKYFRDRVKEADWQAAASHLVMPRTAPRHLLESQWDHATPGEEHLLLRWATTLPDGHELGERIVMLREPDNHWRTAVYEQYPSVNGDLVVPQGRGHTATPPPAAPRPTTIALPRKP